MSSPSDSQGADALDGVARGQRQLAAVLPLNIAAGVFLNQPSPAMSLLGLALFVASLVIGTTGMLRVTTGLGAGICAKTVYFILLLVPLVNLAILLILDQEADAALRRAGYTVRWFGAQRPGC
jgi:hypothetical protein